jgi:hypothetical protein
MDFKEIMKIPEISYCTGSTGSLPYRACLLTFGLGFFQMIVFASEQSYQMKLKGLK